MQRYEEIAGVPSAHGQCEGKQNALQLRQLVTARDQLSAHPERQHSSDAVPDQL